MAVQYSIQKMVSDGTLSTIALGIQYLQRNDIYMRIAGVDTPQSGAPSGYTWSFVNNTTLKILPVVPNGVEVVVYRRTDVDAMYNIYSQNAQFDEATIDENNQQLLYIAQEYLEQGIPGAGVDTIEFLRDDGTNTYYRVKRTDGSYSDEFTVPSAGSAAKIFAREATRRSYAAVGLNVVTGSFQAGFTLVNANDVALDEVSGKAFSGITGTYPAGTSTSGFTDVSDFFGSPVNIEWFGASVSKSDNLAEITAAISYCRLHGKSLYVPGYGALTFKFSGTLYPNGIIIFGDGELASRLEYTGTGIALRGDDTTIGSAVDQALFDFGFRDILLKGPGKSVAGSIGIDGNLYRPSISNYTITGFETGISVRGAIIELGRGRVTSCKWPVIVRPYKDGTPTTTAVIRTSADNCDNGLWVDHIYSATPVWPQTSGSGGAASIVFRDSVVEKCTGTAYIVNRAAHVVFDNAYEEQNGKAYEITSSVNPTFLRSLDGFGSAAGTIDYTGLAEVDQGYTANELFGTVNNHLYVGGKNAKGGAGNPFASTAAGRAVRAYLSGCAAFVRDADATTSDLAWMGNTANPKKYAWSIDDSANNWLRLSSYTDAGVFSKTGFVFDQINGRFGFGSAQVNTAFLAAFNGHIGPMFDNIFDFGSAPYRGRVAYFGTGAINTSDAREKSDPQSISDALLDVADSIEIVLFQWLDAIREKGEDLARWHFGAIAQQIRDAFEAKGLDGRRYGLLCYDKWEDEWESVTEEVVESTLVKNEDGSEEVISTSHFVDTGEKRLKTAAGDRWGVRPDQCHWLLLAAMRRRIARTETRLASIEAALTMYK